MVWTGVHLLTLSRTWSWSNCAMKETSVSGQVSHLGGHELWQKRNPTTKPKVKLFWTTQKPMMHVCLKECNRKKAKNFREECRWFWSTGSHLSGVYPYSGERLSRPRVVNFKINARLGPAVKSTTADRSWTFRTSTTLWQSYSKWLILRHVQFLLASKTENTVWHVDTRHSLYV